MLFINLEKNKVWDPSHDSKLKDQLEFNCCLGYSMELVFL